VELAKLNFVENYNFKFKERNSSIFIYDIIRQKYIILSPEEWVRQHWIHFLHYEKKMQKSKFVIEKKIELNGTTKRMDILIYKKENPFILIECKSPDIEISQATLEQSLRYNKVVQANFIILSNGLIHKLFQFDHIKNEYLEIYHVDFLI